MKKKTKTTGRGKDARPKDMGRPVAFTVPVDQGWITRTEVLWLFWYSRKSSI